MGLTWAGARWRLACRVGDLAANWNNLTLGDLFYRMRTSMPQNDPGSLSRHRTPTFSLSYSSRKTPEGTADLPTQPELLNTIKYLATRP